MKKCCMIRALKIKTYQDYDFSTSKLAFLTSAFYCLTSFIYAQTFIHFLEPQKFAGAEWLWPVIWLNSISIDNQLLAIGAIWTIGLMFSILSILLPMNSWVKILSAVFFFQMFGIWNSCGKIYQDLIPFVLVGFLIAPISGKAAPARYWYWGAQSLFAAIYFVPGLQKIFYLLRVRSFSLLESNPIEFYQYTKMIESPHFWSPLNPTQIGQDFFWIVWLGIATFQTLSILVPSFPRTQRAWGIMTLIFHGLTIPTVNVTFGCCGLLALVMFTLHPYESK